MVIISEVISVTDVVVRATSLLSRLPDEWYKNSSEMQSFKSSLSTLSQKSAQWESQLLQLQYGMKPDPIVHTFLSEAIQLFEVEKEYYEKHQRSWRRKLMGRPFPKRLAYIMSGICEIVEAGPSLLAQRVKIQDLLIKKLRVDPPPLPFGHDSKYVQLQEAVDQVQWALEDTGGPQVVIVYGEPGTGKSSLAKYVALQYQELSRGPSPCFFDGVQYLFCGRGSLEKVRHLRKALFSNLGLGVIVDANLEEQDGDHSLSFYQSALRRALRDRRQLIVLDDVWVEDFFVLTNLISGGTPCRYLLTSQTRNVWPGARCLRMPRPTGEQALKILSNHMYTVGISSSTAQLPSYTVKSETEILKMVRKLENHPLSLVNIAVSMKQNGTVDLSQWKSLDQNVLKFLDQNHHTGRILTYERPYVLSVSASMMHMVESLPAAERNLLFLISLLQDSFGSGISQSLIRFFFKRLHHENSSKSTLQYFSALKNLEDCSLVQVDQAARAPMLLGFGDISVSRLSIHNLRREFIRQKGLPVLQSITSNVVATHGDHHRDKSLVSGPDRDHLVAVVLSTLYVDDALIDEVALPFQNVMTNLTTGEFDVIPHALQQIDAHELVVSAKRSVTHKRISGIFELLNLEGDEPWKQQARVDASKVILKMVCEKQLEDESLASLLRISHITATACHIFREIFHFVLQGDLQHAFYFGPQRKTFSATYPATWRALLNVCKGLSKSGIEFGCSMIVDIMPCMLQFESESTLSVALQMLGELATQFHDPLFQQAVDHGFVGLHDSRLTSELLRSLHLPERLQLSTILWKLIDDQNHSQPDSMQMNFDLVAKLMDVLDCVYRDKDYIETLLTSPFPCGEWFTNKSRFRQLLRLEQGLGPRWMLGVLSGTPEFVAKAAEILQRDCWEEVFTLWPGSCDDKVVRFWGNVALVRNLHDSIRVGLVKLAKSWLAKLNEIVCAPCTCSCRLSEFDVCRCSSRKQLGWLVYMDDGIQAEMARTVLIIHHFHANSSLLTFNLEGLQPKWNSYTCTSCWIQAWRFYVTVCMGKAKAYDQMEMYAEAILSLISAQLLNDAITDTWQIKGRDYDFWVGLRSVDVELRAHIVYSKVLLKDYQGAMKSLRQLGRTDDHKARLDHDEFLPGYFWKYGDRGVLFRLLGEFAKAIFDFDRALEYWETMTSEGWYMKHDPRVHNFFRYCLLRHRGYAKYLMDDLEGSKVDMESAENLKLNKLTLEPILWECFSRQPMGFASLGPREAGLNYSLLQVPVDPFL